MKTTDSAESLALVASSYTTPSYDPHPTFYLSAYPVTVSAHELEVRNVESWSLFGQPTGPFAPMALADLRVSAHSMFYHSYSDNEPERFSLIGWNTEYRDVFSIDARRARTMVKTLDAIEKKLAAKEAADGRPESFGRYLIRVAAAIGATKIVIKTAGNSSSYDRNQYRFLSLADGMEWVNRQFSDYVKAETKSEDRAIA